MSCLSLFTSHRGVLVEIIALTGDCLYLHPSFGVEPWTLDCEI